jgi:hypothetical protein
MHVEARVTKFGVDRLVPMSVNIQTRHGGYIVGKNDRFWNKNASKRSMKAHSTSWDPENLFKNSPASPGLIERKLMSQRTGEDQESKAAMESFMSAHKEEVQKRRESREVPDDPHDLVEYFLDTEAPDMSYEVARCRPKLNDDFFAVLNKLVGIEQISPSPDEERLAELEILRDYLKEATEAVDNATKEITAAPVRLKKLMESKDKKETLLQMAGDGEIDQALMDLLEQNIEGAKEAGREDIVEFMTKVRQAAGKYLIAT